MFQPRDGINQVVEILRRSVVVEKAGEVCGTDHIARVVDAKGETTRRRIDFYAQIGYHAIGIEKSVRGSVAARVRITDYFTFVVDTSSL